MKLSKEYQYQVLCEDAQMRTFINAFLAEHGINAHRVSFCKIPCGKGCGEAYVRRELSKEVKRLKSTNYVRKTLIVCADADNNTVEERLQLLSQDVNDQIKKWNRDQELIVFWIPKRQIETWIHFLQGETVDETKTFVHSGKPVSCKSEVKRFAEFCQDSIEIDCSDVKSLLFAKEEYKRVCQLQR